MFKKILQNPRTRFGDFFIFFAQKSHFHAISRKEMETKTKNREFLCKKSKKSKKISQKCLQFIKDRVIIKIKDRRTRCVLAIRDRAHIGRPCGTACGDEYIWTVSYERNDR